MLNRWIEGGLLDVLEEAGAGCIVLSPLAQGLLTDRYLAGIPARSRASRDGTLSRDMLSEDTLAKVRGLHAIAHEWLRVLRDRADRARTQVSAHPRHSLVAEVSPSPYLWLDLPLHSLVLAPWVRSWVDIRKRTVAEFGDSAGRPSAQRLDAQVRNSRRTA